MCCDLVVSGIVLLINVTNAVIPSEVEGSRWKFPLSLRNGIPRLSLGMTTRARRRDMTAFGHVICVA